MTQTWLTSMVDLLYPNACLGCGGVLVHSEQHICTNCRVQIGKNPHFQEGSPLLEAKFNAFLPVNRVYTYLKFTKNGIAQELLHQLKYGQELELGLTLGKMCAAEWPTANDEFDAILPVPIHANRLAKRGYNQSEQIALGLAQVWQVPLVSHAAIRIKATQTQTGFTKWERWKNVEKIFEITHSDAIQQKNILVVDDVLTTGATILSLLLEINTYSPKSISVLAMAHPIR